MAFGVGSQRAMAEHPELAASYQVRDVAPDVVLIGNVGAVQALDGSAAVVELAARIGAARSRFISTPARNGSSRAAIATFRGLVDAIRRIVAVAKVPVLVKETAAGLSRRTRRPRAHLGRISTVDNRGRGGTSWIAVEAIRAEAEARKRGRPRARALGLGRTDGGLDSSRARAPA